MKSSLLKILAAWRGGLAWLPLMAVSLPAASQDIAQASAPVSGIYTCIDSRSRRLTADRPIPECSGREQHILNRDGSLRQVVPATMTAEERARMEARDRALAEERAARADAVRRDRNLLQRYPNEEAHRRSRESALDTTRLAMGASDARLSALSAERKPLLDEAEFYHGKPLPLKLRVAIDANDAASEAQRVSLGALDAEIVRINRLFDTELVQLRRLWAGAPLGAVNTRSTAPPAR